MTQVTTRLRPAEIWEQMGPALYRAAAERGMSLSGYLETYEDPSSEYDSTMQLDAFGRVLQASGLRTQGLPHMGLPASTYGEFVGTPQGRALIPEIIFRLRREVATGVPFSTRSLYLSADGARGSWERPYSEAQSPRWATQLVPAIPLSTVVGSTTSIDSDSYRAYYLQASAAQTRYVRVGEGAEVPTVKLVGGEQTIDLYKFGVGLEATYEQLRRQRFDKLALHVRRVAVQAEVDKLGVALSTIINGDGNSNSATVHNLTTLDSTATPGTLTLKAWLAFKMKFANPYTAQVALCREAEALQLLLLNVGSANVPLVSIQAQAGFGGLTQINPGLRDNLRLGWTDEVPANRILAIDPRLSLERVIEAGARIDQVEEFITRQTNILVMTEVEGYAIIDQAAARILRLDA